MREERPYNDEQWNDLPIPDSNASWQKMEVLLDKDKKRRRILPFWWWQYAVTGLLLTGLAIGGWLWLRSDKNQKHDDIATHKKTNKGIQEKERTLTTETTSTKGTPSTFNKSATDKTFNNTGQPTDLITKQKPAQKNETTLTSTTQVKRKGPQNSLATSSTTNKHLAPVTVQSQPTKKESNTHLADSLSETKKTTVSSPTNELPKKDSAKIKDATKAIVSPPVADMEDKKKKKEQASPLVWSAGIGLQQSIAVSGQQSSSYNYNGNQSSLSDHIPSAYVRLQKGKWFAQAEFHYAVPQPVQNFSFSQHTRYDVANLALITERSVIQKLYYHQLPLSVNYYVLPNWSVGGGAMYNILAGAVTEEQTTSKNVQTGAETLTKNLAPVKGYKDSFLYKTTAGILLQTDYQWKRFSLGLRFTQNLQPFIKYTSPDGAIFSEKNAALQVILRFRLWSSK